ncbi:MAG: LysM peptidoglycan-binding domain-containing protein [Verrucomicrobiota bacterium]
MPSRFLLLLAPMVLALSSPTQAAQKEITARTRLPLEFATEPSEPPPSWRYLLHLPSSYAGSRETWPLLFYLHGRSIRGNDLSLLKRYGPPMFLDKEPDFPFVVVSPQLPDRSWPSGSLLELLDEVQATYRIDPQRVYLTGVSLGGGGSWYLAASDPQRFAALVPLCGYAGTSIAPKLTRLPIWAFHGEMDEITPLEPHLQLVNAVKATGSKLAHLTIIPDGTHGDIIVPTYKRQDLWDWLLSQRLSQPLPPPPPHLADPKPKPKPVIAATPSPPSSPPHPSALPATPRARPIPMEEPPPTVTAPPRASIFEPTATPPTSTRAPRKYVVRKGDTLWRISRTYETTVEAIQQANRLKGDTIYVDQVLVIP